MDDIPDSFSADPKWIEFQARNAAFAAASEAVIARMRQKDTDSQGRVCAGRPSEVNKVVEGRKRTRENS